LRDFKSVGVGVGDDEGGGDEHGCGEEFKGLHGGVRVLQQV